MKLIDANKYFEIIRDDLEISGKSLRRVVDHLHEMETVDAVEVVHGRWIRKPIGKYAGVDEVCCSICGTWIGVVASDTAFIEAIKDLNYCHNCGARMDGGN